MPRQSLFVPIETKDVDLGNGNTVTVMVKFPFGFVEDIQAITSKGGVGSAVIEKCITGWNLVDENGADVPVTAENIRRLDPTVVNKIGEVVESALMAAAGGAGQKKG